MAAVREAELQSAADEELPFILEACDVQYVDHLGDDARVVNAARISFAKEITEMKPADKKLLRYLWEHEHTSPFRHCSITFRIKAPIFVLRQWMKHVVGCAWNERSGRYTEFNDSFYQVDEWRTQSAVNKQGSGPALEEVLANTAQIVYEGACSQAVEAYNQLRDLGVSKEQARIVLPVAAMSECYWTASLQAIMHFLKLRTESHAQREIQIPAYRVLEIAEQYFPECMALAREHLDVQ
jgi:thymidylate synthase (FAD)